MKPSMDFSIPVSGGVYLCDNPFLPPLKASGGTLKVTAAEGRKMMYFSAPGGESLAGGAEGGETVSAYFDSRRWC
jgi:hypothetical protein